MDTSETYIKMCEEAEEVQRLKKGKPEWGVDIEPYNYYGIHDSQGYYPLRLDDRYVLNITVGGYVYNKPQFGCAVDADREIQIQKDEVIWLPCQDQLQEMVFPVQEARTIFAEFTFLVGDSRVEFLDLLPEYRQYTSMEQLLLAFVMRQKYNKIWDGEQWIREV